MSEHHAALPIRHMLSVCKDGLRGLGRRFRGRRSHAALPEGAPSAAALPPPPGPEPAAWADRLWGEGFLLPGGAAEIARLSVLLPLSPATTLLLLGQDAGGAARNLTTRCGTWVAAHQHDPCLAGRMAARLNPLGRRVQVLPWDPATPDFRPRFHHHALALEPLRPGPDPARLLAAIAAGLKPGGHLVLLDLAADAEVPPSAALRRWMALEGRDAPPPGRETLETAIQAAGFTLHVAEDAGQRHGAAALDAWGRLTGGLRGHARPSAADLASLVTEAETWLLRQRLLGSGALRLFRWHATLAG